MKPKLFALAAFVVVVFVLAVAATVGSGTCDRTATNDCRTVHGD